MKIFSRLKILTGGLPENAVRGEEYDPAADSPRREFLEG